MKERVLNILREICAGNEVDPNANFIESGLLDSFDVVSLVSALDEEFKISIDGVDINPDNFATLDSIVNLLQKYTK